jgi:signal transduction histidine kinase
MRRSAPVVLVALGVLLLLGSYVWYTQRVVNELRREAARTGQMFARIYGALSDPNAEGGDAALLDLSKTVQELGVPVILTDSAGHPTAAANLPFVARIDDPRVAAYVVRLDRQNRPVVQPGFVTVHFGNTPLVNGLRVIPLLQVSVLAVLIFAGMAVLRSRNRAERERVWAGMARESAHQLGTPLSSLQGWLELLGARDSDPLVAQALPHMAGDVERLERVAHRFERIGRPPRRDPVDVAAITEGVVDYFRARVPTLANPIALSIERGDGLHAVAGDRVLLEWAVESLVKNAIDALAGRGGSVTVRVDVIAGGGVRVRVADDGPGVPRELRARIFSAGFTTKERGWGIGLALTRRIVEENHGGRLQLVPSDRGAVFDITLPG